MFEISIEVKIKVSIGSALRLGLKSELLCNEVNVLRYFTWVDYFTLYL